EKQKTEGRERAKTRLRTHPPLASQFPKPPPILGRTVKKKPTETGWSFKTWWPGAESNHRHADFQSAALPTELPGRRKNVTIHQKISLCRRASKNILLIQGVISTPAFLA